MDVLILLVKSLASMQGQGKILLARARAGLKLRGCAQLGLKQWARSLKPSS